MASSKSTTLATDIRPAAARRIAQWIDRLPVDVEPQTQLLNLIDRLVEQNRQLVGLVQQYHEAATTDPLTGLANRRGIELALQSTLLNASRQPTASTALLLMDVDHFKQVNSHGGHLEGDRILAATGQFLRSCCRRHDFAGRLGGDEFIVLLSRTPHDKAVAFVRRIRRAFLLRFAADFSSLRWAGGLSIGVALIPNRSRPSLNDLIQKADRDLYRAKQIIHDRAAS